MKAINLLSGLFVALGLFSANVSASDKSQEMLSSADKFFKVSYARSESDAEQQRAQDIIVVINKLKTYWVKAPHSEGRIRITVPVRYYLSSWDVKALETELERLGVKVKPRPIPPKPSGLLSG